MCLKMAESNAIKCVIKQKRIRSLTVSISAVLIEDIIIRTITLMISKVLEMKEFESPTPLFRIT